MEHINQKWRRLPDVPQRSDAEIERDRAILEDYFTSKRTEPTPEEIRLYCLELKTTPEWIETFFNNLRRRRSLYSKAVHTLSVPKGRK